VPPATLRWHSPPRGTGRSSADEPPVTGTTADLVLLDGVCWRGAPVPGERSQALLAALAGLGTGSSGSVGAARLVDAVWDGSAVPANPAKALQVLVSRTRAQTGPEVVVRAGDGYALGPVSVDARLLLDHVEAAAGALRRGDPATARDRARLALELSLGPDETSAPPAVTDVRREAGAAHLRAEEVLGRALSLLGQHAEALGFLEAAVARRTGDEGLLAALLRSESAVRGAPAALERFERHREGVRDRLGTDPGPELQTLHAELLLADRPVRGGLRHDATRLIGRDEDVVALAELVRTSRLVSVLGAGGLGKTRLAHTLALLAEEPVVHFVELAGVTSPDGVGLEVASALGVRESVLASPRLAGRPRSQDVVLRLVEQLGSTPALLVLDNCEHLVAAVADLVAVLLARVPRLRVLTTTRAPLGLAAERVYPLPSLGLTDGVELFRERATAARPGVRLPEDRVAALVERLDGLPLAVELAAAQVRVMSVEEIERRLEHRFSLLRGGSREAPERHQTLLAVIDWSWNLLDEHERVALRRLSVFRDGFSLSGAAAVLGTPDAVPPLTALVDQSLVVVQEADTLRYRLLETVREFGRMQLVTAGDDAPTGDRLRRWAVEESTWFADRVFTGEQVTAVRRLRGEEGNLTDVLRTALDARDVPVAVPVLAALSLLWTIEGTHLKVIDLAEAVDDVVGAAEVVPGMEDATRAALAVLVMNTMIFTGVRTPRVLERLRDLGPGTGSSPIGAMTRMLITLPMGEGFGQLALLEELCQDPDPAVARLAFQWASQARENAGDLAGAETDARRALALCAPDEAEGPWNRAMLTAHLAGLALQVGDRDRARAYAETAVPLLQEIGVVDDLVQLRCMVALVDIADGRLEDAERQLGDVEHLDPARTVFGGATFMLAGAAELALARGDVARGLDLYARAVTELRSLPGQELAPMVAPWLLYPQSASICAHVHAGHREEAAPVHAELVAGIPALLEPVDSFGDFPITGAVLLACGVWDLSGDEEDRWADAVRLLAVADAFAYNRMLPSLAWSPAAALAEQRCPGLLATSLAELSGRSPVDLRDDALGLLPRAGQR